jgi:hypothetical protein
VALELEALLGRGLRERRLDERRDDALRSGIQIVEKRPLALFAVGVVTATLPARRAALLAPTEALRYEI